MYSVGVIYGVLGCLALTNAQQYYNREDYYKQFPQYTSSEANSYHGYSTPPGIKSNANSVQVIEVSIPSLQNLAGAIGISKSDESVISDVIKQYLTASQSGTPYTFSIQAYSDKKSPQANSQNLYGTHATINPQSQYNPNNYQQPNYYQPPYDYSSYNYKQQQHQREVEIYEQKLREYYAKYPWLAPQSSTTTASPQDNELVKPNEIIPSNPEPIPDSGKSLADLLLDNLGTTEQPAPIPNNQPSDGKSLLELLNEHKGAQSSDNHKATTATTTTTTTTAPKKSLDDLIGNVFIEKPHTTTEEPPKQEGGKSLFELLAELKPSDEDSSDEVKTKSDVAGGDYGLDVRHDDSKVKRTKRHILREGLRRITERISNFGKSNSERHTRDHDCNHHEGRSHHSHKHHKYSDSDDENDDKQSGFVENHRHDQHKGRHPTDFENGGHGHEHFNSFYPHSHEHSYPHPHPYPHQHPHPHPNTDPDQHDENKFHQNAKPTPSDDREKPVVNQDATRDQPSRKPNTVDAGTQTDPLIATNSDNKDVTLDIDIRGGFEETRRKRHSSKRSRRSPDDEGFVFEDDSETTATKDEVKTDDQEKKEEAVTEAEPGDENATEKEGEEGGLDNRFGLFGGFNRQPGRRPIANLIGGVVNGFLGGVGGVDPYNRAPPPQPYYPDPYGQQQLYGYGNYPPQQPVHIHINNVANANAQSQATNTGSGPFGPHGSNQNAAANAQSENVQNQFGSFQNSGASGQASNLAADGSSGQLSAANAMNQNYQNEFGSGSKNAAQSQSANFDNNGNLALTSSNSGTNHFAGPNGAYDETNSAAQSSLQGQFGTQNSGAQSNTFQGPNGSGASASSQASSINNGHGAQNSGANAAANSGNFGGNSFGNAQSNTYANDQWGW